MVATTGWPRGPIKGHETRENRTKNAAGVLVKIMPGSPWAENLLFISSYFRNEPFGVCLGNSV